MQAIILAAGMGKRLGEHTRNNTKCMVRVNGETLIDRMLSQLARHNLSRVVIVVGYEGEKLRQHIGKRYDHSLNIEFLENPVYDRTNNIYSLALAKEKMQEDDTLLLESDLIFDDELLDLILEDARPNLALVAKYQTWMDGTMVRIDDDCNIVNFVPKKAFKYADVGQYYKTVNIYKFGRAFSTQKYVPFLEAYCKALGNNEYYEQVLRVITFLDAQELKALPIGARHWYEIDDAQDLDIAETIFAEGEEKWKKFMRRYGGYWRFPGVLDYCYLVNPYFPSPRMLDEMRANFNTLLTEYPSGMGVNSLLAGKCFGIKQEYVVPGNGAAELIKSVMEHSEGKFGVTYPTFEEYPNRLAQERLEIFYPGNHFSYTADDLMEHFSKNPVSTLLLVNPDNPSGNFIPRADIVRLAEWTAERGMRFIVDESFVDFSENYEHNSLLCDSFLEKYPHVAVMKSISKSFGVPGLRLGILASAHPDLQRVKRDVAIWNLNSFAEFFMQIFNKYTAEYAVACRKFQEERTRFHAALSEVDYLKVLPSQANYFLCEVLPPFTSHGLAVDLLQKHDILIKDCSTKKGFDGRNFVRLAIRNRTDNEKLIEALKEIN